jgi:hypothetical protein
MTRSLSPAADAAWEAFNDVAERVGTFEDHGDALAAAIRALADQVVPEGGTFLSPGTAALIRAEILAIAAELEG